MQDAHDVWMQRPETFRYSVNGSSRLRQLRNTTVCRCFDVRPSGFEPATFVALQSRWSSGLVPGAVQVFGEQRLRATVHSLTAVMALFFGTGHSGVKTHADRETGHRRVAAGTS